MRLIVFILIFIAFQSAGQQPFSRQLWLNENNTAVNVRALAQSTDGSLMLGTDAGLYRFNGRQFVNIPDSIHRPVTAIAIVSDGTALIGYNNGMLASIKGNKITSFPILGKHPVSAINSIHVHKGIVWLSTETEGIFAIYQHTAVACGEANGLSDNFVYNAMPNEKGDLICATDQGIDIIQFGGNKMQFTQLTTSDGLQDNIVRALRHSSYKHLWWYGTQDKGVGMLNDSLKTVTNLKSKTSWEWGQINDILLTAPDHLYISTEAGYLVHGVRNKDSITYVAYQFKDKKLKQLLLDKAGNIWCATNQGMLMFTASFAASIKPLKGYSLRLITALTCDKDNNLWYAQGDTIWKLPLQAPQNASTIKLKGSAGITSLYADKYGNLWIGTLGKGLWCKTADNNLKEITGFASLADAQILNIAGQGDTIWVSSLNGVDELLQTQKPHSLKQIRKHNKNAGLGSDYVYQVLPGSNGKIWFATDGAGVCMFDGTKYHHWDTTTGLKSKVVYSITEDKAGDIWAGTLDYGLCYYDKRKWKTILRDDGIQDLNIYSILPTATGQVIIVSQKGIDEWYPQNKQFRHYNRRLGIEIDSLSTILNCIARDKSGNVYVPYEQGFIQFKNQYLDYDIHPEIILSSISLFFKPVEDGKNNFSADENHISLQYEGINYTNPERLFYRYKLEGYNDGWISTNDESVTFPQLPAGKYKFRVQASLNHGFTDVSEASYSFTIAAPIYLQNWFILTAFVFLLGLGYLYLRIRERGLRKITQLQRERMVFEYEHLKSQVNPHFLFNSLNTLVSLIEEDQEAAVDYTVQLSDLYRSALAYRDRDLILLSEEFSLLEKYFYVQKRRFGEALQWQVDIPEDVMHNVQVVPLALQLLVENAIKHNVVSISNPLLIRIKADAESITIQNPLRPKLSKEKGAGLGIMNIKKRYELLTKRPVYFGTEHNNYIVKLPLL